MGAEERRTMSASSLLFIKLGPSRIIDGGKFINRRIKGARHLPAYKPWREQPRLILAVLPKTRFDGEMTEAVADPGRTGRDRR